MTFLSLRLQQVPRTVGPVHMYDVCNVDIPLQSRGLGAATRRAQAC